MARLRGRARGQVTLFEGHDQHRVRVLDELRHVRHPLDDRPLRRLREGRLVHEAEARDEHVVDPVQVLAGLTPVGFGPPLVLALEHPSCLVPDADELGEPLPGHRAVALQERAAVGHGLRPTFDHLIDDAVFADEEASLGDVRLQGRRREGPRHRLDLRRGLPRSELRKREKSRPELLGENPVRYDAVARLPPVEPVLPAPAPEHPLGMGVEVAVDGNLDPLDGERVDPEPGGVGVSGRLVGSSFSEEDDVGDNLRSLTLEGIRRQADGPQEVGPLGEGLPHRAVLLVEREVRGHEGEHPAGLQAVERLREEIVVEGVSLPTVFQFHVRKGRIADDGVEGPLGEPRVPEALDADLVLRVKGPGDSPRE